jgi:threonine efflux protein
MSDWAVLGSVFAVHVLAMVSPGPNVLVVTQTAASVTRRAGVWAALGIAAGAALMSSAALAGLSVVLAHFAWLHAALGLVGGTYLIYLGVKLWRGAGAPAAFSAATGNGVARTDWRAFRLGLATNLTNPKALFFYGSVFAALFAPDAPPWLRLAAVGIIAVNSTGFHVTLACLFSTPRAQAGYQRIKPWVDRVAGTGLALLGLRLMLPPR